MSLRPLSRLIALSSLLAGFAVAPSLSAVELYREDFNVGGVVSNVGWAVWHFDAATGKIINDTAKTSGDRAAVFTNYAGKQISHLYSSINSDNSPALIFTNEFSADLRSTTITSFSVGRFFQDTPSWADTPTPDLNKLQLALRIDDQWYVRSETIIAVRDATNIAYNTGIAPAAVIAFDFAGWQPLSFSIGATPQLSAATFLPTGTINGFGFFLNAYENGFPGYGTTRERIDYVTIEGSISAVPEPSTWGGMAGIAVFSFAIIRRRKARSESK